MERDHWSVYVRLPHGGGYPILIDWGCLPRMGSLLRQHSIEGEAFLLSDKTVWGLYGETLERGLQSIVIGQKSPEDVAAEVQKVKERVSREEGT